MTVSGSNLTENFTAAAVKISGTVTFNGAPVATNLTMSLSGAASKSSTPDVSGGYIFNYLGNGSYKVAPTLTHPAPVPKASPSSANVVINGKSVTQNFTYNLNSSCKACH